jgi:predicted amidophosphoribosyltransferase
VFGRVLQVAEDIARAFKLPLSKVVHVKVRVKQTAGKQGAAASRCFSNSTGHSLVQHHALTNAQVPTHAHC